MGFTLRTDPQHPSGGYAILAGPDVTGVSALSIENVFSSQFLGPDGKWGKLRHAFSIVPVEGDPAAVSLGPEIVDHVLTDLLVALRDGGGNLLGRLVWPDSIVPRRDVNEDRLAEDWLQEMTAARGRGLAEPRPDPGVVDDPTLDPVAPDPVAPDPVAPDPEPVLFGPGDGRLVVPPRRWWVLPACLVLAVGVGLAAWSLRSASVPVRTPPVDLARHCADAFDGRVKAAQDASDNDRVKLAEDAIQESCGAQAFRAVDGTRWETNEPAAWYQARFYDPNESAPVFRAGHAPEARAAFDYYARWADRSPRQAEALKKLCVTDPGVVGDNAQRKRACAR